MAPIICSTIMPRLLFRPITNSFPSVAPPVKQGTRSEGCNLSGIAAQSVSSIRRPAAYSNSMLWLRKTGFC